MRMQSLAWDLVQLMQDRVKRKKQGDADTRALVQ